MKKDRGENMLLYLHKWKNTKKIAPMHFSKWWAYLFPAHNVIMTSD